MSSPRLLAITLLTGLGLGACYLGIDSVLTLLRFKADIGYQVGGLVSLPIAWGLLRAAYLLSRGPNSFARDLLDPIAIAGIALVLLAEAMTLRIWGGVGESHWLATGLQALFFGLLAYLQFERHARGA
jgi:hypothetical protein